MLILLLLAAAVAAVIFLSLPAFVGLRLWLTATIFAALTYLSGMHSTDGTTLEGSIYAGWATAIALSAVGSGLVGVALRAALQRQKIELKSHDTVDSILAGIALWPLGGFLVTVGSFALSATAWPVAWHIGLMAIFALIGIGGLWGLRGVLRGLAVGLAVSVLWALVDSMTFESEILANMNSWYDRPGVEKCLATGPEGRPITDQRPLMKLTIQRPLFLHVPTDPAANSSGPVSEAHIWSFSDRIFTGRSPSPPLPHCTRSAEPLLP